MKLNHFQNIIIRKMNQIIVRKNSKKLTPFMSLLGVLLFLNLIQGCAINNFGIVKVRHFENETVHMVNLKVFGGFLSTNEADAGLTFGFTERRYFYPKNTQLMKMDLTSMLKLIEKDHLIEQKQNQSNINYSDTAIAWLTESNGLTLNTNSHQVGFFLGISKTQILKLHKDFDGVFIFRHNSSGKTNAFYYKNKSLH